MLNRGGVVLRRVPARLDESSGRWRTTYALKRTESARIAAGGLVDEFGETNGSPSATVG